MDPITRAMFIAAGGKTFKPTMALRFYQRHNATSPKVLQQAWRCAETGDIEWRDVPLEVDY